jgi:aromatic ring-opening dioxygenase catalytic subunit (LigB family)
MAKIINPVFISHGSPYLLIQKDKPEYKFLKELGSSIIGKPKAIVCLSAHWETRVIEVTSSTNQIYDFYGCNYYGLFTNKKLIIQIIVFP